jgi:hypothetical protein
MRALVLLVAVTISAAGAYAQINESTLSEMKRMHWATGAHVDLAGVSIPNFETAGL